MFKYSGISVFSIHVNRQRNPVLRAALEVTVTLPYPEEFKITENGQRTIQGKKQRCCKLSQAKLCKSLENG